MSDNLIVAAVAFTVSVIAIMTPIIRLNSHITELNVLFKELKDLVKDKTDNLDRRVTEHGKEIDELKIKQAEHETRLNQLGK